MDKKRFVVMGAGEVGYLVAQTLSEEGHRVTMIDLDPDKRERIEEELDVSFVLGNGAHLPVLESAGVAKADLFIAASSSEEANLVASLTAKDLGVGRTVVRVETTEDLTTYRATYERLFAADLLLSPQILASTVILNHVLGHNTHDIDYLARGRIQLRKIQIQRESPLTRVPLRDVRMPGSSRIIGYIDESGAVRIPEPDEMASAGEDALVVCSTDVIREVEELFASKLRIPGTVVVAGATKMGLNVARSLVGNVKKVKLIEADRRKARHISEEHPEIEVVHGDATDQSVLRAENVGAAEAFIAATGHDDSNLMAGLEAEELGVKKIIVLVDRSETSRLWRRIGTITPISARSLAAQRIRHYIEHGYRGNMISLEDGALRVVQRKIYPESPVAGVTLRDINPPRGVIVGAVVRGDNIFVPRPSDALLAGDQVVLFVHESESSMVQLFFPGKED